MKELSSPKQENVDFSVKGKGLFMGVEPPCIKFN